MPTTTPPWTVDGWDLAADLGKIEQQLGVVCEILDDPVRFELRHPATSGWGLGEHAGHIAITMLGIAKGIEGNLASPERDRDLERGEPAEALLRNGTFPRGVKAPERIDPKGRSREDLAGVVRRAVDAWSALAARSADIATCPARFPHFMLGWLTSSDWVRFCAIHTAHHLALVRDIEAKLRA
jgi:hypothetical protein